MGEIPAKARIRFESGSVEKFPFRIGIEVAKLTSNSNGTFPTVAPDWRAKTHTSMNQGVYVATWENQRSSQKIASLEISSTMIRSDFMLFAVTIE